VWHFADNSASPDLAFVAGRIEKEGVKMRYHSYTIG